MEAKSLKIQHVPIMPRERLQKIISHRYNGCFYRENRYHEMHIT